MGVTVHFRGRIEDFSKLEPLEDRVIDLALTLGGKVRIWRSSSDTDKEREVRGVIWDVAPGAESFPLLFSPEGWLVPLTALEDAEEGRLEGPPWVSVKTQFAKPEAHVAVVETLAAIHERYVLDLEVEDEGGYWESRDLREFLRRRGIVEEAIERMVEALEKGTLHPHAKDDAGILAATIEQIAQEVHKILHGPSEHPPATFTGDENPWSDDPGTEAEWDAFYAEHRRKQERMSRFIEEALARGEDHEVALNRALEAEGIGLDESLGEEKEEEWKSAEPPPAPECEPEEPEAWAPESSGSDGGLFDFGHPLQETAKELLLRVSGLRRGREKGFYDPLLDMESGLLDVNGGLAQALGRYGQEGGRGEAGWNLVQLKRALRGAAFAQGALFRVKHEGQVDRETFGSLRAALDGLQEDVLIEIGAARARL
ncbi:MAG: hypothetical protein ACYS47_21420 [Planctomycetota bacterium]|jgi:hypothetical protein